MSGFLFLMWLCLRLLTGHLNDELVLRSIIIAYHAVIARLAPANHNRGLWCGDVEVEIRERAMGDISIYSAEGGSATRQTTPDLRYWGLKERMVGQAPP
jgi:hypothetical protein